jgi:drug/metabolite transporter (DMT)-like permease
MQASGAAFFVAGLGFLPLADNIAVTLAGPLFLTALAPSLLGERVGWRRWLAVGVGFAGIVLMFRPTGEVMRWAALLPVGAALTGAFRDIVTRRISVTESSISMLFYSTVFISLAGLATLPFGWRPLAAADVGLMALSGLLLGAAQYLMIEAFRHAEAAVVAPFRYSQMVWAVLLGFVVFGDLPDRWLIAGAALVISSGLYILHREARR